MSEHKTNTSTFDKEFYWQRRKKGVRGQIGAVIVHKKIKDEDGNIQTIPVGGKRPPQSNR